MTTQAINTSLLLGLILLYALGAGAHAAPWPCALTGGQFVTRKPWPFRLFYGLLATLFGLFCLVPLLNAASRLDGERVGEILLIEALGPLPLFLGCLWWAGPHDVRVDTQQQRVHVRRGFPGLARAVAIPLQDVAEFRIAAPRSRGQTTLWAVTLRRKSTRKTLLWAQFPDEQSAQDAVARVSPACPDALDTRPPNPLL